MSSQSKIISFCSSDSHNLYKGDVFRVLSLPEDSIIQFRYPKRFINSEILSRLNSLVEREGCVFFVGNNHDQTITADKRDLKLFSIRKVIIKGVKDDEITKQVYFFLKLKEFVDYTYADDTPPEKSPKSAQEVFVAEINVIQGSNPSWIDRVSAVKEFFTDHLFFHISKIREKSKEIKPVYNNLEVGSFFELHDEKEYYVDIAFDDPTEGQSTLNSQTNPSALDVSFDNYKVSAPQDIQTFTLQTRSLVQHEYKSRLRLFQEGKSDAFFVDLQFQIERGFWKPFYFGILTSLAALGLLFAQLASKKFDELQVIVSWTNGIIALLAVIFVGVAGGTLFQFFNKK